MTFQADKAPSGGLPTTHTTSLLPFPTRLQPLWPSLVPLGDLATQNLPRPEVSAP